MSVLDTAAPLTYELRLGVTGHRALPDHAATQQAVASLLEQLASTLGTASEKPYSRASAAKVFARNGRWLLARSLKLVWRSMPVSLRQVPEHDRTPITWTIVSSLAVGADRIVARAVLETTERLRDARLEAVLPLEPDEYRRDFESTADCETFDALLAQAEQKTVACRNVATPGEPVPEHARRRAYLKAGREVADSCEILIAVWNREEDPDGVGTAAIVRYAVERGRAVIWIDARDPARGPQWITQDSDNPKEWVYEPLPGAARDLSPSFFRQAAYNRDPAFDAAACARIAEKEGNRLQALAERVGLPGASLRPLSEVLIPCYARADQLAARYQKLYTTTAKWLYSLAAVAVTIPVLQLMLFPHMPWVIVFEVLVLLVILALLDTGRHEDWHQKWLQDRHLAERLRTAMFSVLVGDTAPEFREGPERALPYYGESGGWVRTAALGLIRQACARRSAVDNLGALRRFVAEGWIDDQVAFHEGAKGRHSKASRRAHRAGLGVIVVTLIAATLHALGVGHVEAGHGLSGWLLFGMLLILLSITLPAWGVAIHAINAMLDHDRIAVRSEGMDSVLRHEVRQDIEDAASEEELRIALARAGDLMLRENYEWVTSLAFHDLHHPG